MKVIGEGEVYTHVDDCNFSHHYPIFPLIVQQRLYIIINERSSSHHLSKEGSLMGKDKRSRKNAQNKENIAPDGRDVEFSQELADSEDLQAQERARAADRRARRK